MRNIKLKIKSTIENIDTNEINTYIIEGTKNDNKINFNDETCTNVILIENENIIMKRENNEVEYTLDFKKDSTTYSNYKLKEYNLSIDIVIITKQIDINENSIEIEYSQKIGNEEYNYVYYIEWEELQ